MHGVPVLIVTGRADGILPPNHTSRALFGLNRLVERQASGRRYCGALNARHLDALNSLPGFDVRFVPLLFYFFGALNLLWTHLTEDAALPPSQVVRATPGGHTPGSVPALAGATCRQSRRSRPSAT